MIYRKYKEYTIRKNYISNTYEIRKGYKYLYKKNENWLPNIVVFPRLKDAKNFIDKLDNNEICLNNYEWKSRNI